MPSSWNTDQVLALAPDPGSAKSGKDLGTARKWKTLGANELLAWGEIQGSGKAPYQTSIDLSEPAFKCTCPSRKFPCKHGLGLFLILAQQPAALIAKDPPAWAAEWLAKRAEKAEKKVAATQAPAEPLDPDKAAKAAAAAEKSAAKRQASVGDGIKDLQTLLRDLVRSGFASLPGKPSSFWETPAARLVDAKAKGLGRRLQDCDGITSTGEAWPAKLLARLGWLHLACEAWARQAVLPSGTQADLRTLVGFTDKKEEILTQIGERDHWLILGQRVEEEDLVRVQRTWLFGSHSRRFALCLSFAPANQPLDVSLVPGTIVDAELVFFPGAAPLRALVKQRHGDPKQIASETTTFPHAAVLEANIHAAESFATNPWLERVPFALSAVIPSRRDEAWFLRDSNGHSLPLAVNDDQGWKLVALSGGRPLALAGEWDGETFRPLSAWAEERFLKV